MHADTATTQRNGSLRRGRLFGKLLLLLFATLVAAALGEGILRLAGYQQQRQYVHTLGREKVKKPLPGIPYLYPAHGSFRQTWPDNPRGYFDPSDNGLCYELNSFGFRDDEFTLERDDKIRIAFLGDSFCWGIGVRQEHHFATLTEQWLNQQAVLGQRFEVFNFCLAGYSTAHEAALYEHVVRHFRPDITVVWFFLNDINTPPQLYFRWHSIDGGTWLGQWRQRLHLLDLAVAPFNRAANHRALINDVELAYQEGHPAHAALAQALARIRRLNEADGVAAFLVVFPWLYRLEPESYAFSGAHQTVRALATEAGFQVLDLLPTFTGRAASDLWVHAADHHPNQLAHRLAAQELCGRLAASLQARGELLPAAAARRRELPPALSLRSGQRAWWEPFAALAAQATPAP